MAAATRPANCERPPDWATIAVRGGLALTGKGAEQARRDAAGANADKIAIDVENVALLRTKERVVAAVCTMTTMAISNASGNSACASSRLTSGKPARGRPFGKAPSTSTPRSLRPKTATASCGQHHADQGAGDAGADALGEEHDREHAEPECRGSRDW